MLYEIYLIINLLNNKKYIGQTKQGRHEERWKEHTQDSRHKNRVLYNALKKDEKNNYRNFAFSILEENIPEDLIDQKEIEYILKYNTHYKTGYGYNMTYGGQGIHGYIHTEETKNKISNNTKIAWDYLKADKNRYEQLKKHRSVIAKGKPKSEEHKAKLSLLASQRTGEKNPFFGKHFSEESIEKLRQSHAKKFKNVCMYTNDTFELVKTFESASSAARFLNRNATAIGRILSVCNKKKGTAYGYIWRYEDDAI